MQILETHDEAGFVQGMRRGEHRRRLDEQIEILGLPVNAGVFVNGVRARDHERDLRGVEGLQRAAIDFAFLVGYPEVPVGQRLSFFRRQTSGTPTPEAWHLVTLRCDASNSRAITGPSSPTVLGGHISIFYFSAGKLENRDLTPGVRP